MSETQAAPATYKECSLCLERQGNCNCKWPCWVEHCTLPEGHECFDGNHWRHVEHSNDFDGQSGGFVERYESCPNLLE